MHRAPSARSIACILACSTAAAGQWAAASDGTSLVLLPGHHEILHIPKIRSVRVGVPGVIDAKVIGPGEVMVTGLSRGDTALSLDVVGEPETLYSVTVVEQAAAPTEKPIEQLQLGVGYQKSIKVAGVKRVAVGDPKVADVHPVSANELLLTGVGEGRTTVFIWQANDERLAYLVKVEEKPLEEYLKEIKQLLGPMEGVSLSIVGERIILDGEFQALEDVQRAGQVCKLYEKVLYCMARQ